MPELRSPWVAALVNPLNLAMLGLAVGAGLLSAWWLFPIGLVLWAVMVSAQALDPRQRLALTFEARGNAGLAQRFQTYFDRLERLQAAFYRSLAEASGRNRRRLEPLRGEVDGLVEQVYELGQRMTALENQRLVEQANADTQQDLVRINELIAASNDAMAKREYEQSRQSLEQRQTELQRSALQLDRFEALLTSVRQELERVQTEVVGLHAARGNEAEQKLPALLKAIQQERSDLTAFDQLPTQPSS